MTTIPEITNEAVGVCSLCRRLTAAGYYIRAKHVMRNPDRPGRYLGDRDKSRHVVFGWYNPRAPRYVIDENDEFCDGHSLEEIAAGIRQLVPPEPPLMETRLLYNPGHKLSEKLGFIGYSNTDANGTLRGVIVPEVEQLLPALKRLVANEAAE